MNVKSLKKGFTLTELIIVVVIIAVLAGILIPTFATVVKKNNKASDLSLVRSLNEALVIDSAENGKHETMHDALAAAEKCGFNVAKITNKSQKYEIVWDSVNDVFCYLNEGEVEYYPNSVAASKQLSKNDYRIWIISDKPSSSYSTYLYGVDAIASIDLVGTGLDVGDVKVDKISYTGASDARTVDIRTNWGELTINAPKDTVNHYNELNKLVVKAVASASFHSHGFIAEIVEFLQGNFVAEDTATFGQTYEEVLTALNRTNVTNNIGTLQSLATVVFNQDAWDENGMSKNHEGRINEDPEKGTVHVHTEEIDPAVPATCTSTGLSQGSHCTVCGAVIVAQTEVAKLSHTVVIDPAVPATCDKSGLTQGSHCSVCGAVITKQEVIPAGDTGHTYQFVNFTWDAFTATNGEQSAPKAIANFKCSRCGATATVEATVVLNKTTLATCTAAGSKIYYASVAANKSLDGAAHNQSAQNGGIKEFAIAKLEHDIVHHAAQAATCTTVGWEAYDTCSRCDYTTYKEIAMTAHTLTHHAAVVASCTSNGNIEYWECEVCHKKFSDANGKTEVLDVVVSGSGSHDLVKTNYKAATCGKAGNDAYWTCSICGKYFSDAQGTKEIEQYSWLTPATLAHTYGSLIAEIPATKDADGMKAHYHCSVCDKYFDENKKEISYSKLAILYVDYNLTLNNAVKNAISGLSKDPSKPVTIVFDYSSNVAKGSLTEIKDGKGNNFPSGVKIYVNNSEKTIYFLSDSTLYLGDATGGEERWFFGELVGFVDMKLVFNNLYIDNNSKISRLFMGYMTYVDTDFESFFEGIEVPKNGYDKTMFLRSLFSEYDSDTWAGPDFEDCTFPKEFGYDAEKGYFASAYWILNAIDDFQQTFNDLRSDGITPDTSNINLENTLGEYFESHYLPFFKYIDKQTILIYDRPTTHRSACQDFVLLTYSVSMDVLEGTEQAHFIIEDVKYIHEDTPVDPYEEGKGLTNLIWYLDDKKILEYVSYGEEDYEATIVFRWDRKYPQLGIDLFEVADLVS